jgi:drug/metabolite transporter (DMT)-like permease
VEIFLCGMITACNWVAATIFLRFWRQTRDRLFLFFALAFIVFGFSRMPRAFLDPNSAWVIYLYVVRFVAFASILLAIVDKNLQTVQTPPRSNSDLDTRAG